jgi:hypothetical protein
MPGRVFHLRIEIEPKVYPGALNDIKMSRDCQPLVLSSINIIKASDSRTKVVHFAEISDEPQISAETILKKLLPRCQ